MSSLCSFSQGSLQLGVGRLLKLRAVEEIRPGNRSTVVASIGKIKARTCDGYEEREGYSLIC